MYGTFSPSVKGPSSHPGCYQNPRSTALKLPMGRPARAGLSVTLAAHVRRVDRGKLCLTPPHSAQASQILEEEWLYLSSGELAARPGVTTATVYERRAFTRKLRGKPGTSRDIIGLGH